MPRSRLPDPARRFQDVERRRVPQLEFGAPIPMIRAVTADNGGAGAGVVVPSGNITDIPWRYWEITDVRFFAEGTVTGDFLNTFYLLQYGNYDCVCSVYFDETGTIPHTTVLLSLFQIGGIGGDAWLFSKRETWGRTADQFGGEYAFHKPIDIPPYDPEHAALDITDLPTSYEALWQTNQDSGVDQEVYRAEMAVYYRGPILTAEYGGT